jgi:hypothetical protein
MFASTRSITETATATPEVLNNALLNKLGNSDLSSEARNPVVW